MIKRAAGSLVMAADTGRVLMALRSEHVHEPGVWAFWGGSLEPGEKPREGALRELREESGYDGRVLRMKQIYVFQRPCWTPNCTFRYINYLVVVPEEFEPDLNWETDEAVWTTVEAIPQPRHYGVQAVLGDAGAMGLIAAEQQRSHRTRSRPRPAPPRQPARAPAREPAREAHPADRFQLGAPYHGPWTEGQERERDVMRDVLARMTAETRSALGTGNTSPRYTVVKLEPETLIEFVELSSGKMAGLTSPKHVTFAVVDAEGQGAHRRVHVATTLNPLTKKPQLEIYRQKKTAEAVMEYLTSQGVARRANPTAAPVPEPSDDPLYHITFLARLPSIAEEGLTPGTGKTFASFTGYAQGWLFLTDGDALRAWFHKVHTIAEGLSDDPTEEGWIPVVLRLSKARENELDLEDDPAGNADVLDGKSYRTQESIAPEDLELWNGRTWVPLEHWESVDPELGVTREPEGETDDDGQPVELIWLNDADESGLFPFWREDWGPRRGRFLDP